MKNDKKERRDIFAAFAMMGILSSIELSNVPVGKIARDAFAIADAMIKESDKSN